MGFFDDLRRQLGLESEREKLDKLGLVEAPPERIGGYVDHDGNVRRALDPEAMYNAEQTVYGPYGHGDAADAGAGAKTAFSEQVDDDFRAGAKALEARRSPALAKNKTPDPKALLAQAFARVGVNPEDQAESPEPAQGQQPEDEPELKRRPLGVIGTAFTPAKQNATGEQPQGEPGGSTPERMAAQMATGSTADADLKKALDDRQRRIAMADGLDAMASGADIAGGTHYNSPGAYLRQAQAQGNAGVDRVTAPVEFSEGRKKFASDQLDAAQRRQLNLSEEGRKQAAEGRASKGEERAEAEETRRQKGFDTKAAEDDASSQTSANARASIEALYPQTWQKIPKEVREKFSASDVKRIFGEVGLKDFRTGSGKGSAAATSKMSSTMRLIMQKEPEAFHNERQARAVESIVNDMGGWDKAMVGIVKGAVPNQVVSEKDMELRQRVAEMIAGYANSRYGAALSDGERKMLNETVTQIKAGEPAPRVKQSVQLIRERNRDRMQQLFAGQPQEVVDAARDAFEHPEKTDIFGGPASPSASRGGGKVRVSNGKEQFMVDPADLAEAQREGFHMVE